MCDPRQTDPVTTPATAPHTPRRSRRVRAVAAIGGTAVAAGLGLGGLAIANAQDSGAPAAATSSSAPAADAGSSAPGGSSAPAGSSDPGSSTPGQGGPGRGDYDGMRGEQAKELAAALGVDEARVTQALTEIRDEQRSQNGDAKPTTPPSEADRQARRDEMAGKLAEKLGVDKAKVTDALDKAEARHRQQEATRMTSRLDQAVAAGTLTEADKASVLKAVQAGVLGGPGGR